MRDEAAELVHQRRRLTRHDDLEVVLERRHQAIRFDDVGQDDHEDDHQRHDREERVVRDSAREQETLVCAECAKRLRRERKRLLGDLPRGA